MTTDGKFTLGNGDYFDRVGANYKKLFPNNDNSGNMAWNVRFEHYGITAFKVRFFKEEIEGYTFINAPSYS